MDSDSGPPALDAGAGASALVAHARWKPVSGADDPFADRVGAKACTPPKGYRAEDLGGEEVFAVQTEDCNYLTVSQPTGVALAAGDHVDLRFFHFPLLAPAGEKAHVAVRIGDQTVWEVRLDIPKPKSELIKKRWTSPRALPAGTTAVFHVHNHGKNEYALVELSRVPSTR